MEKLFEVRTQLIRKLYIDKERRVPRKENIKNVDSLPIHADLLRGFGFEQITNFGEFRYKEYPFEYSILTGILYMNDVVSSIKYFHDLQNDLVLYLSDEQLKFEWKGVKKMIEIKFRLLFLYL